MSMEAEVMRSRCLALLAATIEAAEMADKRSVPLDGVQSLMMAMMRLPIPGAAEYVKVTPLRTLVTALPAVQPAGTEDDGRMGAYDGTR